LEKYNQINSTPTSPVKISAYISIIFINGLFIYPYMKHRYKQLYMNKAEITHIVIKH